MDSRSDRPLRRIAEREAQMRRARRPKRWRALRRLWLDLRRSRRRS